MLSIPTDCPQREKAGWTGDMLVYSKTAMQIEDCTNLFTRWLENMACDQDKYGAIPMVVPNSGKYPVTGKMMNLMYGGERAGHIIRLGGCCCGSSLFHVSDNRKYGNFTETI